MKLTNLYVTVIKFRFVISGIERADRCAKTQGSSWCNKLSNFAQIFYKFVRNLRSKLSNNNYLYVSKEEAAIGSRWRNDSRDTTMPKHPGSGGKMPHTFYVMQGRSRDMS
jgi:hypothetical protein